MNRHVAVALSGGVGAALCGLVSCTAHADDGLTAQQIAFAARIVRLESGGRLFDGAGRVLTSSAGALGPLQLMKPTAARLGVDPYDPEGNVRGGLTEIVRLWRKYDGDERLVAAAYNCGEQCVADWLAGRRELPGETVRYIAAAVGERSDPVRRVQYGSSEQPEPSARRPVADVPDDDDPSDPRPQPYDLIAFAEWRSRHDARLAAKHQDEPVTLNRTEN